MIRLQNISKTYAMGESEVRALRDVSLDIAEGEFVAIMGPSGSGKSTLMHILGLLDAPDSGEYFLGGNQISKLPENQLAQIRNQKIGFIFQMFNLLARTTSIDNVLLPTIYGENEKEDSVKRAVELLERLGVKMRAAHKPNELSGGEQQRIAIARALVNQPQIILADEPTGNLDSKTQTEIMNILSELNRQGLTVIIVTHEEEVAKYTNRLIRMKDGQIIFDSRSPRGQSQMGLSPITVIQQQNAWNLQSLIKETALFAKEAMHAISANKVRSALSVIGILIGVASVISMLALGEGTKASVTADLESMGSNLLVVRSNLPILRGVRMAEGAVARLTFQDALAIEKIPDIKQVNPMVSGGAQVVYKNKNWNTEVRGVTPAFVSIRSSEPVQGRFFASQENETKAKVAVLGATVVRELFGEENPVNQTIRINRVAFVVIGVLPEKGGSQWRDPDDVIVIPLMTAMKRLLGTEYLQNIDAEVISREKINAAKEAIQKMLVNLHRLPENRSDSFQIRDMTEIQESITKVTGTITIFLSSIAGIALLVGGIGIMNIMLVSVTERTREIGLRKAVGARTRDIYLQFLIEAVVVSLIGGLLGITVGTAIAYGISAVSGWTIRISLFSVLISVGFSIIVGILFGFWPAQKAAKLDPITALRYE